MERVEKCKLCGTENTRLYYCEDMEIVENYYSCKHCGYTEDMAYSGYHIGIDTLLADSGVWPPAKRLFELAKADREGRVVVLPCKRGHELWMFDTGSHEQVYSTRITDISTLNRRTMLNTSTCGVIDARDIGVDVFLTREEAEKALALRMIKK